MIVKLNDTEKEKGGWKNVWSINREYLRQYLFFRRFQAAHKWYSEASSAFCKRDVIICARSFWLMFRIDEIVLLHLMLLSQ